MSKIHMKGQGKPDEISNYLSSEILSKGASMELVDTANYRFDDAEIFVMVFEKYYFRNSSRASLTVSVAGTPGEVQVDAISSGAGQGILFRFSWGAEEKFVGLVESILREKNFV
ncbi:MAG TPA: hypothetical protein DHN33_05860 [Eubacteriaceae bacterium]|nr:hypothetical protein [Eubacteriaceae bacterium]